MRKLSVLLLALSLAACGGGSGSGITGPVTPTACSNDGQKQFVLDNLYYWYLWNDLLPANININDYATPEELATRAPTERVSRSILLFAHAVTITFSPQTGLTPIFCHSCLETGLTPVSGCPRKRFVIRHWL